jgi:hypothetical protein
VSFTATSNSGLPAPTAQWQVSADNITYTNLTTGTSTISTTSGGVTTAQFTFIPSQSDMEKFYRVVFTNACGSVASTGAYLYIGGAITVQNGQNEFDVQIVACDQATVCTSITYTWPNNVFGWVHTRLEIGQSSSGPWSFVFEDSSLTTTSTGSTTQQACFPVTGANNGQYLRWKIWNYGCSEYQYYQYPLIIYPKAVATTVNSCVGGGPVTFTENVVPPGGTWTINGGGNIDASTGVFTPTSPGCWQAIFTAAQPTICGDTAMFVVFPASPVLSSPANTCNSAFSLPTVTAVAGFNVQYNIDGSGFTSTPTIPTTIGCHTIQARYVTATACDTIPAGTAAPSFLCK